MDELIAWIKIIRSGFGSCCLVEKLGYLIPNLKCWVVWYKEETLESPFYKRPLKVTKNYNEVAEIGLMLPKTVKLKPESRFKSSFYRVGKVLPLIRKQTPTFQGQ